jgi:hypothetical protein
VIRKPKVPEAKHLNLYQNGFLSVIGSAEQGPGTLVLPQRGTVVWLNVLVPQTGKAVGGFWPRTEHTCDILASPQNKHANNKTENFKLIPQRPYRALSLKKNDFGMRRVRIEEEMVNDFQRYDFEVQEFVV